jgi:rod shape-determining protein MreC
LTGNIFSAYSNFTDYFKLKKENQQLVEENARLRNELESSFLLTDTSFYYKDTLYRYIPAHVVSLTLNKPANYLIVNKGVLHGIKKEMGVVSGNGVAGIVIGVSKHYSLIMPLLHHNAMLSARIKKYGLLVNVLWETGDYRYGKIIDIPSHINLQKGDTIVTSGLSSVFPENIPVGIVESYEQNTKNDFSEATIRFSTDYKNLMDVYIIENLFKPELQELKKLKDE